MIELPQSRVYLLRGVLGSFKGFVRVAHGYTGICRVYVGLKRGIVKGGSCLMRIWFWGIRY